MDIDFSHLSTDSKIALAALALVFLSVRIAYANTFRKLLSRVTLINRFLEPGHAWWLAVPVINIYWNFVMTRRLSDTLTNEFYDRQIAEEADPGKRLGLTVAFLYVATFLPLPVGFVIGLNLAYLIYFVAYWLKVHSFLELLRDHDRFLHELDEADIEREERELEEQKALEKNKKPL